MSEAKKHQPSGVKYLKVAVPQEVAEYYERRATQFATSISAAAAPVLCAQARGEIRQDFTQLPGSNPARP